MSITDELRKFAWKECPSKFLERVIGIADDIEHEYESLLGDKEEELVLMDGNLDRLSGTIAELCSVFGVDVGTKRDEQIRSELVEAASNTIPLPKDADGVPIHVGDRVVDWDTPRPVVAVSEDSICLAGYESDSYYRMGVAKNYRHYHEPTVEGVLREFTDAVLAWAGKSGSVAEIGTWGDVASEYIDKLRLAGEDA